LINEHELIQQTFAFVKNIHQKDFSGHDFEHIKRVWHNGQLILADENHAERFIVEIINWAIIVNAVMRISNNLILTKL
jgi:HD superfamily phosphodiesterase